MKDAPRDQRDWVEDMLHRFKDEDACLRTRHLPGFFDGGERAGCVQVQDRVGDGTWEDRAK